MSGPLAGVRIVELAGIGPGPFAAMMLSDMGADVIRIDRPRGDVRGGVPTPGSSRNLDILQRGRRNIAIDLKSPDGVEVALDLIAGADALIEGFRPGVTERLGLGPDECLARNPKLVYGRMTGWGQTGPYAQAAGHDINYISLAGALAHFGRAGQPPTPPLNMVGDFGGGGMYLAFGIACGLLEAQRSGEGQVIDAAMVDGAASMMSMFWSFAQMNVYDPRRRGVNLLDTGAHFYDVYRCADGEFVSIGAIEPQFYAELLRLAGLEGDAEFADQLDSTHWAHLKQRLAALFATKTRDEWCEIMEYSDVCFAPVLWMEEAARHPHNVERETFIEIDGVTQPAPAPRFSRTAPKVQRPPSLPGQDSVEVLTDWGVNPDRINELLDDGVVEQLDS